MSGLAVRRCLCIVPAACPAIERGRAGRGGGRWPGGLVRGDTMEAPFAFPPTPLTFHHQYWAGSEYLDAKAEKPRVLNLTMNQCLVLFCSPNVYKNEPTVTSLEVSQIGFLASLERLRRRGNSEFPLPHGSICLELISYCPLWMPMSSGLPQSPPFPITPTPEVSCLLPS